MKKSSKRRVLFAVRTATMIGAAWFAVNGITDTLGQEKEKSRPVYIATEGGGRDNVHTGSRSDRNTANRNSEGNRRTADCKHGLGQGRFLYVMQDSDGRS